MEIYDEELAHTIMEAEKFQSASGRPRKAGSITQSESTDLRTGEPMV